MSELYSFPEVIDVEIAGQGYSWFPLIVHEQSMESCEGYAFLALIEDLNTFYEAVIKQFGVFPAVELPYTFEIELASAKRILDYLVSLSQTNGSIANRLGGAAIDLQIGVGHWFPVYPLPRGEQARKYWDSVWDHTEYLLPPPPLWPDFPEYVDGALLLRHLISDFSDMSDAEIDDCEKRMNSEYKTSMSSVHHLCLSEDEVERFSELHKPVHVVFSHVPEITVGILRIQVNSGGDGTNHSVLRLLESRDIIA
jgi:hypothetical protein